MASHGWGGDPPADDVEARQRIIDTTAELIDRWGAEKTSLSDVAQELGVTRQTVYRHVGGIGEILSAVAAQGAADFVDQMVAHLDGITDPAEAVIEGFLYCLRTIPSDPRLNLLLQADTGALGRAATSAETLAYGAEMLRRYPVDWAAAGVSESDLHTLAEVIMRLLISMLQNPDVAERPDAEVRELLQRWVVPGLNR